MKGQSLSERLWQKVTKSDGCWLWNGHINQKGYGTLKVNGVPQSVHRIAWELYYGEPPGELLILQTCNVRHCLKQEHLIVGKARHEKAIFENYINKDGPLHRSKPELGPCWLWAGEIDKDGYGRFPAPMGKYILAHRAAWEFGVGPIPDGLRVLHSCDVRNCVCGSHLFLGTNDDNSKDMVSKGRQARGEKSGQAKLNEQQVKQIRALRNAGWELKPLAMRFGVHFSVIWDIANRVTWKHVS